MEKARLFTHTVSAARRELVIVCTCDSRGRAGRLPVVLTPIRRRSLYGRCVGSLALGGALGIIAVLLRQEFLLVIMGACSW